jgi:CheY-like chemotaxis protein
VARDSADSANRAKSMFLANMSHELRTPLNAILGYAQLLKRDRNVTKGQAEAYNTIQQSGEQLLMLIIDILDISKIEAGKIELHLAVVDMSGFLRGVANIIRIKAEEKGIDFGSDIASDVPPFVQFDDKHLRQVLLNLLSNAVKFTDAGRVDLRVKVLSQSGKEVRLRFEVRDSGTGIAADQLEKVFRPFEQVCDERHRAGGTGLGLSISRQLVRFMGSDIRVESTLGSGSCFSFELAALMVGREQVESEVSGRVTGYKGPRMRVQVVDDIAANRSMLTDTLGRLGFEVSQAANGLEALTFAQAAPPDLILMDIRMPVMGGLQAMGLMQEIPELRMVPVVVVSAGVTQEKKDHCMAAGAKAFLTKPIENGCLLQEIGRLLNLTWIREDAQWPTGPADDLVDRFVVPEQAEMESLHVLAKAGNMRGLREQADRLAASDPQYHPFANRIIQLAAGYQSKALLRLVEKYTAEKQVELS